VDRCTPVSYKEKLNQWLASALENKRDRLREESARLEIGDAINFQHAMKDRTKETRHEDQW